MAEVEISYKGSNIATMNASGTKTLLTEGKYLEDDVTVTYTRPATPSGTKNISITANGQTTEDVTNYASAQITANVPNTYSAGDEGKVVSNGALVAQGSDTVTQNDTYDTTLISSLTVNVSGGNIGGLANMADLNLDAIDKSQWGQMLSAMKNGQTKGGTVKATSSFSNTTERLLLSTGLSVIHGLILVDTTRNLGSNIGAGQSNCNAMFWGNIGTYESYPDVGLYGVSRSMQNLWYTGYATAGTRNDNAPFLGIIRFDGGDIYYTGRYNNNSTYQIIRTNVEYEWLAW